MGDFRGVNGGFLRKWGIFIEKMCNFRLNGEFCRRKCVIFEEKMGDFQGFWGEFSRENG